MTASREDRLRERLVELYERARQEEQEQKPDSARSAWARDRALVSQLVAALAGRDPHSDSDSSFALLSSRFRPFAADRRAKLESEATEEARREGRAPDGAVADTDAEPGPCIRPAVAARVDRYFAGTLSPAEVAALWEHLDDCAACRGRYEALFSEEGDAERRRRRLFRGLPWPADGGDEAEDEADGDDEGGEGDEIGRAHV